jgi:hypothetical protein
LSKWKNVWASKVENIFSISIYSKIFDEEGKKHIFGVARLHGRRGKLPRAAQPGQAVRLSMAVPWAEATTHVATPVPQLEGGRRER